MKGFKDSSGKFHPIGNQSSGISSNQIRNKKSVLPSSGKANEIREKKSNEPTIMTDEEFYAHIKKNQELAHKLGEEISYERQGIIEILESQKLYHEDAVEKIDKIKDAIENKSNGKRLPHEYMHLEDVSELDELIHDWSSVGSDGFTHTNGYQNDLIASDMARLRQFANKVEEYKNAKSEYT